MSAQISWYITGKILLLRTPRSLTDSDIHALDPILQHYLAHTDAQPIYLLVDDSAMESMASLEAYKSLQALKHPNVSWIVVVGLKNRAFRMMYAILCHFNHSSLYLADTMDEAVQFIQQGDSNPAQF